MAICRSIVTAVTLFVFAAVLIPSDTNCYRLPEGKSTNSSSNLILGERQGGDILLYDYKTFLSYRKYKSLTKDVIVPRLKQNGTTISYISVINLKRNTTAYAKLIDGGLGYPNATIRLTSQKGHGLYYVITVYGLSQDIRNQTTNSSDVVIEEESANITAPFIISGNDTLFTNGSANTTENIFDNGYNNLTSNATFPYLNGNETQFLNGSVNSTESFLNDGYNNYTNHVTFIHIINENGTELLNGSVNATRYVYFTGYNNYTNNVTFPYVNGNETQFLNGSSNFTENIFDIGYNNYTNNVTFPYISGNETQFLNGSSNFTENIFDIGYNNYTNNVTFPYISGNETQFLNGSSNFTESIFDIGYNNYTNNVTFPYINGNETQYLNGSSNFTESIFDIGYNNYTNNVTYPYVSGNETKVLNGSANATEISGNYRLDETRIFVLRNVSNGVISELSSPSENITSIGDLSVNEIVVSFIYKRNQNQEN